MTAFLKKPWINKYCQEELDKIKVKFEDTRDAVTPLNDFLTLEGKSGQKHLRAQIIKVNGLPSEKHGLDLPYLLELSDSDVHIDVVIPKSSMENFVDERKNYAGLMGSLITAQKFRMRFSSDRKRIKLEMEEFGFAGMEGIGTIGDPKPISEIKSVADKLQTIQKSRYELDYSKFLESNRSGSETPVNIAPGATEPDLCQAELVDIDMSNTQTHQNENNQRHDHAKDLGEDDDDEHSLASLMEREAQAEFITQYPDQPNSQEEQNIQGKQNMQVDDLPPSVTNATQSHPDWGSYTMPSFLDSVIPSDQEAMMQTIPVIVITAPQAEPVNTDPGENIAIQESAVAVHTPAPIAVEKSLVEQEAQVEMEVSQEAFAYTQDIEDDQMIQDMMGEGVGTQDSAKDEFELIMGEVAGEELDSLLNVGVSIGSILKSQMVSIDASMSNEEMAETQEFMLDEMDDLVNYMNLDGLGEDLRETEVHENRFVVDDSEEEVEKTDDEDGFYSEVISLSQEPFNEGKDIDDRDANSMSVELNSDLPIQNAESTPVVMETSEPVGCNQQNVEGDHFSNPVQDQEAASFTENIGNEELVESAVEILGVNEVWDAVRDQAKEEQEDSQDSINTQPESIEEGFGEMFDSSLSHAIDQEFLEATPSQSQADFTSSVSLESSFYLTSQDEDNGVASGADLASLNRIEASAEAVSVDSLSDMDLGSQQALTDDKDLESQEDLDDFLEGVFPKRRSDIDSEEELDSFFIDDAKLQQNASTLLNVNAPLLNDETDGGDDRSEVVSQQFVGGPDMVEAQVLFSPDHQMRTDYSVPTSPFVQGTYITPQKVRCVEGEQTTLAETVHSDRAPESFSGTQVSRKGSISRKSLNLVLPKVSVSAAPERQVPVESGDDASKNVDGQHTNAPSKTVEDGNVDCLGNTGSNNVYFNSVEGLDQKENIENISMEQLVLNESPKAIKRGMFDMFLSSRRSGSIFPLLAPSSLLRMSLPNIGSFLKRQREEVVDDKTAGSSASSTSVKRRKTDNFKPLNAIN